MKQLDILISGAGIAGPVLAYWLHRAGHRVTILERDSQLRTNGQSIDLRDCAVDVVKLMGVEPAIRAKTTSEAGLAFVDQDDKIRALFPAVENDKGQSFTAEYEVMRGELVDIFFAATESLPGVSYVFSESVTGLASDASSVEVTFSSNRAPHRYDLVVAADGLGSKTRGLAYSVPTKSYLRPFDAFTAFYTIDHSLLSGQNYCRWYNATRGRTIALRPDPQGHTRVSLNLMNFEGPAGYKRLNDGFRSGTEGMRELLIEEFHDAGWKAKEVLAGLKDAKDLYGAEVAQIQVDSLHKGRVALVGDAGYCPTPFTGMGTSLAVIGAYVLAGELLKAQGDVDVALDAYQDIMLPYARKVQDIPTILPKLVNPKTWWGIRLQLLIFSIVAFLQLGQVVEWVKSWLPAGSKFELPQYHWPSGSEH